MRDDRIIRKSLRSLLLVNWSKFGAQTIRVNGSVLFTGVNGSGKSTLLDAMMYVITGNTTFNIAAQDRDRTVLSYVRGDTKSKGAYRYLRSGEVISYLVMEFDSPTDNRTFVVGVCIESRDEQDQKSFWFVRDDASIQDFNFYKKEDTKLFVTPRLSLCCNGEKLKAQDFMKKEQGVKQIMRMMGLRGINMQEYRSKLLKMLAFKPENHIDHFIRDCVLQEHKIETIPQLQEQKQKYDELADFYQRLLRQKEQLELLEAKTVQYEAVQRNVNLKWMVYHYQCWILAKRRAEELSKLKQAKTEAMSRYKAAEVAAKAALDQAGQAMAAAKSQYEENDLTGSIRTLKENVNALHKQIQDSDEEIKKIRELQTRIRSLLANAQLEIVPSHEDVLSALNDPSISSEMKYSELRDLNEKVKAQKDTFSHAQWDAEKARKSLEEQLSKVSREMQGLQNHQRSYPDYVETARRILQQELIAQGTNTHVRTLAELVKEISRPEWRDALEAYLGDRRFHLLVDPEYTAAAMEIFHRHHLPKAQLVMTDKLPDHTPDRGSAAEILNVPNPPGRRYINYLLGRIHLCETLDELHSHPLGGLMADGTLAKGYSMRMLDMQKLHYYLGADAIALEIDVKKQEHKTLTQKITVLTEQIDDYSDRIKALSGLRLDGDLYDFTIVEQLPKWKKEMIETQHRIEEMEKDPDLMMLGEALEHAENDYHQASKQYGRAYSNASICYNEVKQLEADIPKASNEMKNCEDTFQSFALQHLELKREAIEDYEKQTEKKADGIVITEKYISSNLEKDLDRSRNNMENEQLKYCQLAGLDLEKRGVSFISYFRKRYEENANVHAEEAHEKLSEMQKQLESAFMTECVAELIEAIHKAQSEVESINRELKTLPFGDDIYSFTIKPKADKEAFFRIMKRVDTQSFGADAFLASNANDPELEQDIREFMERILQDCDDTELTDYRNYMQYDMDITSRKDERETSALSEKQGSASNGEKQTPYFIILAASLMQCYPRTACCARLVFIDEAFSALSSERIQRMVQYFEQNGFQVMYAAPPEKINTIGRYIQSTVSLVEEGRYTYAVEGLADEFAGVSTQRLAEEDAQLAFAEV